MPKNVKICIRVLCNQQMLIIFGETKQINTMMTVKELRSIIEENGNFSASNDSANWFAIGRKGFYYMVIRGEDKFMTEMGFVRRLNQLANTGW